jgi:hypothetical protein
MAKEMRALLRSFRRAHAWAGMLLPACTLASASACSNGLVQLQLLPQVDLGPDAGANTAGAGGGGTGGAGGRGGGPGELRGGAGGLARFPTPCDGLWQSELENALRDAFNDALASGSFCPRDSSGLRRPLDDDPELQWQAHAAICAGAARAGTWTKIPRTATWTWILSGSGSLEDAKKALLDGDDRATLCDDAKQTSYRAIGVGHLEQTWSVFISPGPAEAMR